MSEKASDELTAKVFKLAAENEALRHRVRELGALLMGNMFAKPCGGGIEGATRRLDEVDFGAAEGAATSVATDTEAKLKDRDATAFLGTNHEAVEICAADNSAKQQTCEYVEPLAAGERAGINLKRIRMPNGKPAKQSSA